MTKGRQARCAVPSFPKGVGKLWQKGKHFAAENKTVAKAMETFTEKDPM